MAAVLEAAICSRIVFSIYFAVRTRRVRVPGGIKFHLEPGTIRVVSLMQIRFGKKNILVHILVITKYI